MERKMPRKAAAILYDKDKSAAPRIIAKGQGALAQKIIDTAREAGVYIQDDPDLVELLSKVPLGDEIPVELYQAIAEVLAFVYKVNSSYKAKLKKSGL